MSCYSIGRAKTAHRGSNALYEIHPHSPPCSLGHLRRFCLLPSDPHFDLMQFLSMNGAQKWPTLEGEDYVIQRERKIEQLIRRRAFESMLSRRIFLSSSIRLDFLCVTGGARFHPTCCAALFRCGGRPGVRCDQWDLSDT